MSKFSDIFSATASQKLTENGAKAYSSTGGGKLLDLFAKIGGLRNADLKDIISMWEAARNEDKELADNLILYTRDIRKGGIGERRIGLTLLRRLAELDPKKVERNFKTIVDCGRWDDLYVLFGTSLENSVIAFYKEQFVEDLKNASVGKPISQLGKWLKSANASSKETRALARKTYNGFGISERTYRKGLSVLRKTLDITERKMSKNQWEEINYPSVPSVCMNNSKSLFWKHDMERFNDFLEDVREGTTKINASVLTPADILRKSISDGWSWRNINVDDVAETQWAALPNYVPEDCGDVVIMADCSGSMSCDGCRPIATSVGLAIYFAQRNEGDMKGKFMTFSFKPSFIDISDCSSLKKTVRKVFSENTGLSTDLDAGFKAIYDCAVKAGEAPTALVVVSDMEIDRFYSGDRSYSIAEKWDKKFSDAGLTMPKLIFWNVESRNGTVLAKAHEKVGYVSGSSFGSFKHFIDLLTLNAYEAMVKILTKKDFSWL